MELSFNDLKKRDVINVSDGRCLGRINNIVLRFPEGVMTGIVVPGKKGFLCFVPSENIFIDRKKIVKIGNDVILVNLQRSVSPSPPHKPPRDCCGNTNIEINNTNIDLNEYE